jgi:small GTP-binding protein
MIQKKICLLGAFAVGKTSLVSRYVRSMFDEKYQSTVGVKVDKKIIEVDGRALTMVIWDLFGQDDYQQVSAAQLRGMAGCLLVADGTRRRTLAIARELHDRAAALVGPVPFLLLLNKADLEREWDVDEPTLLAMADDGWRVMRTSARTGANVEAAFEALGRAMIADRPAADRES